MTTVAIILAAVLAWVWLTPRSVGRSGGRRVGGGWRVGGGGSVARARGVLLRLWQVIGRLRGTSRAGTRTVDNAVVLDLAAAALGSGMSIPGMLKALDVATGGAAPRDGSGGERTRAANMLLMGARWDEAWEGLGQERLREALRASWTDGAAPVPLIERSAQSLRLRRQRNAKEAAAKLGARLVMPLGLCFLPAFILVGIVPVVAGAAGSLF